VIRGQDRSLGRLRTTGVRANRVCDSVRTRHLPSRQLKLHIIGVKSATATPSATLGPLPARLQHGRVELLPKVVSTPVAVWRLYPSTWVDHRLADHSSPTTCHMHEPHIVLTPPSAAIVALTCFFAHTGGSKPRPNGSFSSAPWYIIPPTETFHLYQSFRGPQTCAVFSFERRFRRPGVDWISLGVEATPSTSFRRGWRVARRRRPLRLAVTA
jgi:hypothetical protein